MTKPVFGLRKPPDSQPASPTQLAAFIQGVPDAPPQPPRGVVTRADGRQRRRTTVYLPPTLARKLALYCAERGVEMSNVVAEALERHFANL